MDRAIKRVSTLFQAACIFFLLCLVALCCPPLQAAPPVLLIATNDAPPYISADRQNSFLTDLLDQIAKKMGVSFELRFMPWPRCELAVDELQVWATMPYVPTPERESRFLFSQPLFTTQTLLFHYTADGKQVPRTFQALSELKPYKMGGVRGYYYENLFAQAGLSLDLASSEESSFRKLRAGRVDMVPAVDSVGWGIIHKTFTADEQANFHTLETPLNVGSNFLMSSRRYPQAEQLMASFNEALATLRSNGVYKIVADRHGIIVAD